MTNQRLPMIEAKPDKDGAIPNGVAPPVEASPPLPSAPPELRLSLCPDELDEEQQVLLAMIRSMESELSGFPLLLVQNGSCPYGLMCDHVYKGIRHDFKESVKHGTKCTVILHSYGGMAGPSFRLARFLQRYCGGYDVVIPSMAKSAATLFALGADHIYLGEDAELGPLDAQITDLERETSVSALEVVQCVERLSEEAVKAVDACIVTWVGRSGKKIDSLLPVATKFVAELMHPLFHKVDAVGFTGMARVLAVANDYAVRLLAPQYGQAASRIALTLTSKYSDHDYAIDADEAKRIGLRVEAVPASIRERVEELSLWLDESDCGTMIGRMEDADEEGHEQNPDGQCAAVGKCGSGLSCRTH